MAAAQRPNEQAQNNQQQQNSTTGRQPDGSYIAPTGPGTEIGSITDPNGPPSVLIGNGQCVTATAHFSGVTANTHEWTRGEPVVVEGKVNPNIPSATAVATFDSNGRYFPTSKDKNSGIFVTGSTKGSFWLVDQWPAKRDSHGTIIREAVPPHERLISPNGPYPSDNSSSYYVIKVPR
jgi:hypothetical protein